MKGQGRNPGLPFGFERASLKGMTKPSLLVAVVLLLLGATSFAKESWWGQGRVESSTGWRAPCPRIQLRVEITEKRLVLDSGYYHCGNERNYFDDEILQIKGGELFLDGRAVGMIDREGFTFRRREPGIVYEISGSFVKDGFYYERTLREVEDDVALYRVFGLLR